MPIQILSGINDCENAVETSWPENQKLDAPSIIYGLANIFEGIYILDNVARWQQKIALRNS